MSEIKTDKLSPRTGAGTVTLGTSGDSYTIPAGVTLTNAGTLTNSGTASGFGKVLQVVTWSDDTHVTYAAQTTTWTAMPDIAASITPTSTSSKILVNMSLGITAPTYTSHRLTRNGTDLFVGTAYSSNTVSSIGFSVYVENNAGGLNVSFFDSPSTTSAVEYSLKYLTPWSVGDIIYYNRGTDGNTYRSTGTSFITLMEIAG